MSKAEENGSNGAASDGVLHVAFVLDKSGSMGSIEEAVVSGYNDYLGELRAQGGETLYSLTTFDTTFDHVCVGEPLDRVPELDHRLYRPGGMTALYDAIAHTVLETDGRLQAAGRDEEKVLVVVMTDGLENSSTDYDAHGIAELVRDYDERPNWTFVYLGAGHANITDAQHAAAGMGYRDANAMLWSADPVSTRKSMRSLAHATGQRRMSMQLKSERFFADAGQYLADYREDEPAATHGSASRRRVRGDPGVRRRSTASTSAMRSPRRSGPQREAISLLKNPRQGQPTGRIPSTSRVAREAPANLHQRKVVQRCGPDRATLASDVRRDRWSPLARRGEKMTIDIQGLAATWTTGRSGSPCEQERRDDLPGGVWAPNLHVPDPTPHWIG